MIWTLDNPLWAEIIDIEEQRTVPGFWKYNVHIFCRKDLVRLTIGDTVVRGKKTTLTNLFVQRILRTYPYHGPGKLREIVIQRTTDKGPSASFVYVSSNGHMRCLSYHIFTPTVKNMLDYVDFPLQLFITLRSLSPFLVPRKSTPLKRTRLNLQ